MSKLLSLLFPRKCSLCGTPMADAGEYDALCPDCMLKYSMLCEEKCSHCGQRQKYCRCEKIDGAEISLHLFEFSSELSRNIIYTLKRRNDKYLQNFLARQLAGEIVNTLKEESCGEKFTISFVPRNPASVRDFGFDQSKLLAEKIAALTDMRCAGLFVHAKNTKTQKEISAKDRKENASNSYSAKNGVGATGTLVIVDDVTTSGSTLSRCASLAKEIGAEKVMAVAVAMTPKKTGW